MAAKCQRAGVEPIYRDLNPSRVKDPVAYVLSLNEHRRHLTAEFRRARVKELRAAGKSTREIAAELEMHQTQVRRDLKPEVYPTGTPHPAVETRQPQVEGDGDVEAAPVEPTKPLEIKELPRIKAVKTLKESGATDEQVASQLGVSTKTVQRVKVDIAEREKEGAKAAIDAAPKLTGRDGKKYAAQRPHKPAGKPVPVYPETPSNLGGEGTTDHRSCKQTPVTSSILPIPLITGNPGRTPKSPVILASVARPCTDERGG